MNEQPSTDAEELPPVAKPVLIFDGDCGFCRRWIARWRQITRGAVEYLPSQSPEVAARYPDNPPEWYREGVVLMEPGKPPIRCAHAVLRTLAVAPGSRGLLLWLYRHLPGFALVVEFAYAVVARHRGPADNLARLLWFGRIELPRMALTRWIFLRGLGLVYLSAFGSLLVQWRGLFGSEGILPAQQYFDAASQQLGAGGLLQLPTVFWWTGAGDGALFGACAVGLVASLLLIVGVAQVPALVVLWVLYLSLCAAGQEFLQFQWDLLLLEAGFLSIFIAPLSLLPRRALNEGEPPRIAVWMLRWLVARLMFQSGIVKLLSGDPTWRDLTALTYHFETQPLPTWVGWFMHHAPVWLLKSNTLAMYAAEVGLAFFVFAPRGLRIIAAGGFALLQVGIIVTGNYGFFNWLSLVLCIALLDDFVWPWRCGGKRLLHVDSAEGGQPAPAARRWSRWVLVPVAVLVFAVTGTELLMQLGWKSVPRPLVSVVSAAQPFRTLNSYGLFAVMTTSRPEITLEGSNDGQIWRAYEFKYKPGALSERPVFCQPHMPRLDWQMWFAALGTMHRNEWLLAFMQRLLEGNPVVSGLLRTGPFTGEAGGDSAPRYIRARIADYHFTDIATWRRTGNWWRVDTAQAYTPTLTLREGRLAVASDIMAAEEL